MKKISVSFEFLDPVFENVSKLTQVQRILICSATFILVVGLFVWLSYLPRFDRINQLKDDLQTAKAKLTTAQRNAMQLNSYREKMKKAEADFSNAKKALPEKQEIPSLLTNISRSGQDVGLEVLLFQPMPEAPQEFYAEIPLSLKVAGSYHEVGRFLDKVAKLSRIVNIRNVRMRATKDSEELETSCTAVTYKFLEKPQEGT